MRLLSSRRSFIAPTNIIRVLFLFSQAIHLIYQRLYRKHQQHYTCCVSHPAVSQNHFNTMKDVCVLIVFSLFAVYILYNKHGFQKINYKGIHLNHVEMFQIEGAISVRCLFGTPCTIINYTWAWVSNSIGFVGWGNFLYTSWKSYLWNVYINNCLRTWAWVQLKW